MDRTILHCDMNNFYASVECMLNPQLSGKPVAVGGDVENRHGIILAKNYEAKKYGIQTGEALWQAKQKCRNLIIVPPHYEEYLKYSRLAHSIYEDYTDLIEPYGMDEVWLDITGSTKLFGNGERVANVLRERIKFELGLTISVGVSFCKVFAKLGSDMKKPDAVTVIPKDSFREVIWDLPASDLLGVGRSTDKVLSSYGIHTIGELANAYPDLIQRKLGKNGMMLLAFANGEDRSRVAPQDYEPPMKSVGHGITTVQDLENNAEVWNIILALTQDIGHKLRVYNKNAAGVMVYENESDDCAGMASRRYLELWIDEDMGFQIVSCFESTRDSGSYVAQYREVQNSVWPEEEVSLEIEDLIMTLSDMCWNVSGYDAMPIFETWD